MQVPSKSFCSSRDRRRRDQDAALTIRVEAIDRIVEDVAVEVRVASGEQDRIHRRPAPHLRIVVPHPEPHQARIRIVQPARKPERLEARLRVPDPAAPRTVSLCVASSGGASPPDDARPAAIAAAVAAFVGEPFLCVEWIGNTRRIVFPRTLHSENALGFTEPACLTKYSYLR